MVCTGCAKNDPTCFCQKFVKSASNLIIFGTQIAKTMNYVRYTHCPPHIIFDTALKCKMQMLQIVTLRGDYQYHIAHFFIINSTESAM